MSTESFGTKAEADLPDVLRPALAPVLEVIRNLTQQIRTYERWAEKNAQPRYPETNVLCQVAGVGALTALGFVLTLDDPKRFKSSRQVGAFLGLRPRQSQSGQTDPQLRITKAGDNFLRRLLVGSAHYILGPFGPDSDLRRWGLKLASRGGKNAKKRAVVAVARKLAVLLHHLWLTQEAYVPLRQPKAKPQESPSETVPSVSLCSPDRTEEKNEESRKE
jgi:transposase